MATTEPEVTSGVDPLADVVSADDGSQAIKLHLAVNDQVGDARTG